MSTCPEESRWVLAGETGGDLLEKKGNAQELSVTFFKILQVGYFRGGRNNPCSVWVPSSCQRHGA